MKSLWVHAGVFGLAAALGLWEAWGGDDKESNEPSADRVEVWGGSPDSLESIRFESPQRTVVLEPKKDAEGRYYVARVEKQDGAAAAMPDAGASPPAPGKKTTERFIGVKTAEDLAKQLAPLMAMRKIGPIEPKRAEEFGLDKPEGTLKVKIRGAEHSLVFGGTTPGGQERYAKDGTGAVYAVSGDIMQNLSGAESRLLERDLHGFQELDVTRVRISARGKSREISAIPEKKGGWADPSNPTKPDETAGNWMSKLDRLHVLEYVESLNPPLRPDQVMLRVEYFAGTKPLGYLELYKVPGEKSSDYLVKSERTRWLAKVLTSAAEQVDQDLGSVVK
ncbi:MAG TPA: DUF4340 domain-containing protein [Polyangiaceae bacterium]